MTRAMLASLNGTPLHAPGSANSEPVATASRSVSAMAPVGGEGAQSENSPNDRATLLALAASYRHDRACAAFFRRCADHFRAIGLPGSERASTSSRCSYLGSAGRTLQLMRALAARHNHRSTT